MGARRPSGSPLGLRHNADVRWLEHALNTALEHHDADRPTAPAGLPDAVLWDMDGTLIESEPYWMAAEHRLAEQHGATWTHEQALQLVGQELLVSARMFQEQTGVPGTPESIVDQLQGNVLDQIRQHGAPWRPGARELLTALRDAGVPCAMVTMSYGPFARTVADAAPAGAFSAVVSGDEVARGKPDPEPYLTGAARLGVEIARCVAIEDSPPGVGSALAAGARTVVVPLMVEVQPQDGLSRLATLEQMSLDVLAEIAAGREIDTVETTSE